MGHLISMFALIAFILCLGDCTRLLIGHNDSRLALFKSDLCFTPLYNLFHLLKKQIWSVHFQAENYPVAAIAESKQLVIVSKTFAIQALVIRAAVVLSSCLFTL